MHMYYAFCSTSRVSDETSVCTRHRNNRPGLVVQLVEASNSDLFQSLWLRIPPESETFPLSLCGPISFLGLSIRS